MLSLAEFPSYNGHINHRNSTISATATVWLYTIRIATLALAVMVTLASAQTFRDENNGIGSAEALSNGFHLAFIGAGLIAAVAAAVALIAINKKPNRISDQVALSHHQ